MKNPYTETMLDSARAVYEAQPEHLASQKRRTAIYREMDRLSERLIYLQATNTTIIICVAMGALGYFLLNF